MLDGSLSWLDYASVRDNIVSSPRYADILALSDRPDATLFGDAPYLFLYREMDERHPGSKFILTLRDGGVMPYIESELRMWAKLGILERLAAELSLLAALCTGTLVAAHLELNRAPP